MGPNLSTSWAVKIQVGTVEALQPLMSTLPLFLSCVMLWVTGDGPDVIDVLSQSLNKSGYLSELGMIG